MSKHSGDLLVRLLSDDYPRGFIKRHDAYLRSLREYKRERGIPRRSKPGVR